jgi:hypothetical protein
VDTIRTRNAAKRPGISKNRVVGSGTTSRSLNCTLNVSLAPVALLWNVNLSSEIELFGIDGLPEPVKFRSDNINMELAPSAVNKFPSAVLGVLSGSSQYSLERASLANVRSEGRTQFQESAAFSVTDPKLVPATVAVNIVDDSSVKRITEEAA